MLPASLLTVVRHDDAITARLHMETTVTVSPLVGAEGYKEAVFKAVATLWNQAYGDLNRELIKLHSAVALANRYTPSGTKVPTEALEQLIRATSSAALVKYTQEHRFQ